MDDVGKTGEVSLVFAGGIRDGADMAKALALGADAIAVGTGALIALNCNKDIPEADFEKKSWVFQLVIVIIVIQEDVLLVLQLKIQN